MLTCYSLMLNLLKVLNSFVDRIHPSHPFCKSKPLAIGQVFGITLMCWYTVYDHVGMNSSAGCMFD